MSAAENGGPVLILGMHRSGTSCLTGTLEEAGLYLGEVNTAAPFNKKGNRESRAAMELHDAVLARVGASWDCPPDGEIAWTEAELQALADLAAGYPADRPWGLKDPRLLLVLDGWRRVTRPRFIGTFRHPGEVVASLTGRAKAWKRPMPAETALGLWLDYNRRLLAAHDAAPFDIIRYDQDPAAYLEKAEQAARALGLTPPDAFAFREAGLRHSHAEGPVPEEAREVWEALNDRAL